MQYIAPLDYILFLVYFGLVFLLIKSRSGKYRENGLDKYYMTTFFLHIVGAFLYAMVIQYYYGYGDSFGFFRGSTFLQSICKEDGTLKYFLYSPKELSDLFLSSETGDNVIGAVMDNESNIIIIKISAALSLIAFNKYLVITLFFGLFSFVGVWRLYMVFNDILKQKAQRLLALTVLYVPSICFWGSGLIKDSICMGCLGIVISGLYAVFIKKKFSILDIILTAICFYLLMVVKNYIAIAVTIAVTIFVFHSFIANRKATISRWFYAILILGIGGLLSVFLFQSFITSLMEDSQAAIDTFKSAYEGFDNAGDAGSGFTGQSFDFTLIGILLRSPITILTTLFRPFIWEVRNPMMLLSALESLVALLAFLYLLYKLKFKFFSYILSDSFLSCAFIIVVILSMLIGLTTFNFGTMVRYRIPVLPFYSFLLISIYVKYMEQKISIINN